ncbi:MAG: hypothetical protein CVU39_18635 [Chloroflexi bacterium HGW-Chloroflexi-10]|nr:MAG: hypothetical protein CVU39_18635 [Chloroflexi bacterium HGW-Chloroflexi-10]
MTEKTQILDKPDEFSEILFEKLKLLNFGLRDLEIYEFRYALENVLPAGGWNSITLASASDIESQLTNQVTYKSIQLKPVLDGRIQLDPQIIRLTQMLFVGLVTGEYTGEWLRENFYFDIRGFYFLHRTVYFTQEVHDYLGEKPFRRFTRNQKKFETLQEIGYKDFMQANQELDQFFIKCVIDLVALKGTPIILGIAGPTAAGKTEIVMQLRDAFVNIGKKICTIEMDNFLTDREYREQKGIDSLGKEALHFDLLLQSLEQICRGETIQIPQYDFVAATSTHDIDGKLRPGATMLEIEPADIIFIEGNFPFLYPELSNLVGIKVVYMTDDDIRMKRKWRRDIDFRKKYDLNYFRNRYFREQFIMAQEVYIPQMLICDLVVDTTGAALWSSPITRDLLRF